MVNLAVFVMDQESFFEQTSYANLSAPLFSCPPTHTHIQQNVSVFEACCVKNCLICCVRHILADRYWHEHQNPLVYKLKAERSGFGLSKANKQTHFAQTNTHLINKKTMYKLKVVERIDAVTSQLINMKYKRVLIPGSVFVSLCMVVFHTRMQDFAAES